MKTDEPICPVCHFGKLSQNKITHTQIFEGQLIVIPHGPALVCDVCGETILDNQVLTRLSGLLGQERQSADTIAQRLSRL